MVYSRVPVSADLVSAVFRGPKKKLENKRFISLNISVTFSMFPTHCHKGLNYINCLIKIYFKNQEKDTELEIAYTARKETFVVYWNS
jgi:hypothetical protein